MKTEKPIRWRTLGLRIENRVITAFTKPEAGKLDASKIVQKDRVTAIECLTCLIAHGLLWIVTTFVGKLSHLTFRVLDVL